MRRPLEPRQYLSIRYTERLAAAGIEPSVGSTGDSYDNALAETVIGLVNDRLNLPLERSFEIPPTHMLSLYGLPLMASASLPWSAPSLGLSNPALSFSRSR